MPRKVRISCKCARKVRISASGRGPRGGRGREVIHMYICIRALCRLVSETHVELGEQDCIMERRYATASRSVGNDSLFTTLCRFQVQPLRSSRRTGSRQVFHRQRGNSRQAHVRTTVLNHPTRTQFNGISTPRKPRFPGGGGGGREEK